MKKDDLKMRLLGVGKKPQFEKRTADFLKYFGKKVETTRIVSFGSCNFHCPYCKRDGQFTDNEGNIIKSSLYNDENIFTLLRSYIEKGQRIRLSGGDPVMYPKESLRIAKWAMENFGEKISIAHNGSSIKLAEILVEYLYYAAIDLKGFDGDELSFRADIKRGSKMLKSTLDVQDYLSSNGVLVEVRTPVFAETTLDDLFRGAELILKGGDNSNEFWTLRKYNPIRGLDWRSLPGETIENMAQIVSEKFPELPIGLRVKWEKSAFKIWKAGKEI